jgi:hypothetical protein
MPKKSASCPCCDDEPEGLSRREFLVTASAVVAATVGGLTPASAAPPAETRTPETLVKVLFDSLNEKQRKTVCFDWDYTEAKRGLLRTHISNNWRITAPAIKSDFYTASQQDLIRKIFEGMVNPDWIERFDRQFKDDMGGFGRAQGIAIFGTPGAGKFEFVLTGRHGTMRCDGNSAEHVAFGGPIMYGHAASGYFEKVGHPNNVFWHQAEAANKIFQMLSGKQRQQALFPRAPDEAQIAFRGPKGKFDGVPVAELSRDQKEHLQQVLQKLIEPYRQSDRDEVVAALKAQGGLDRCHLAFYQEDDIGNDEIWDNWRLEGPAFVWHWRGAPHVHVWVNVAADPTVALNSKNLSGPLRK